MSDVSSTCGEENQIDYCTVSTTVMGTTSVKYSSDPWNILGIGPKGVVYPGFHFGINKPVAVKFIRKRYLKMENEQVNELKIWCTVDQNVNIVRLYDSYQDSKTGLFLAMEKAERTFRKQIIKCKPNKDDIITWLYQVAQGLKYLHEKGIIHRDIKPENILMILKDGNRLVAKLADFGVSKMFKAPESTGTYSNAKGTFLWMAPEALENRNQKFKNTRELDIFALGMTMYFGLSQGGHPFTHSSSDMQQSMTNRFAKPLSLDSNQVAANDLLSSMMQRQPNNRPDVTQILAHCVFWSLEQEHLFLIRTAICLSRPDCQDVLEIKEDIDNYYMKFFGEIYPRKEFNWINLAKDNKFDIPGLLFLNRRRKKFSREYGDGESVTKFLKLFRDKYVHYPEIKQEGIKWFSDNDGIFCEKVYVKTLTEVCPGLTPILYKILLQNAHKECLLPITKVYFPWELFAASEKVGTDETIFSSPIPQSFPISHSLQKPSFFLCSTRPQDPSYPHEILSFEVHFSGKLRISSSHSS